MSISIIFENPSKLYSGGQTITGNLYVTFDTPITIRKVTLDFVGRSRSHWSETNANDSNSNFRGETVFFNHREVLIEDPNLLELTGNHCFNFKCTLPPNLPSSLETTNGNVRYEVKANVDIPWARDFTQKERITILSHLDLNTSKEAKSDFLVQVTKTVGVFCFTSGNVQVTVTSLKSGYVCGEIGHFYVQVENNSRSDVTKTSVNIVKSLILTGYDGVKKVRCINDVINGSKFKVLVAARKQESFYAGLTIPVTEPTTVIENSVVLVKYFMEVICKISGTHVNLHGKGEIIIGTVPLITGSF